MMIFLSKKTLSYGIAACVMTCSVFGADLSEDDSRLDRLEKLVFSYPPHLVTADITNITTRIMVYEDNIQALTTHFETQITELTTQLQALTARFESLAIAIATASAARIERPISARGYEAIYDRFYNGALIYRPTAGSSAGETTLRIRDLANPLESTFDLSRCGDAATYLSISTGYRREATKLTNTSKWEVFITPKFLIEAHKTTTAAHYNTISNASWTAPFAVIQNYGGWSNINWYWYHTALSDTDLNTKNLYEIWQQSRQDLSLTVGSDCGTPQNGLSSILIKL